MGSNTRAENRPHDDGVLLSAVVIARNNADTIERCVRALGFADEVVVVDACSDDDTAARARALGAVVVVNAWPGFAAQRRVGLERARGRWVFFCDSDEEVSGELAAEIRGAVAEAAHGGGPAGFRVRRRNQFLGAWVEHGPWTRDTVVRLARRELARVTDQRVHEGVAVDGVVGMLQHPLLHYTHRTLAESVDRMNRYTSLEAADRVGRRRVGVVDALVPPLGVFLRYYLVRGCWRDGVRGLLLSSTTAMYKSVLYIKIHLLQRAGRSRQAV